MLADLIHHVRADLNPQQIRKTVVVYSGNLLDATLSPSIQTMSAKLLLNMIDRIMKLTDIADARELLMLILACFSDKLARLNSVVELQADAKRCNFPGLQSDYGIVFHYAANEQDQDTVKGSYSSSTIACANATRWQSFI